MRNRLFEFELADGTRQAAYGEDATDAFRTLGLSTTKTIGYRDITPRRRRKEIEIPHQERVHG